MLPDRGQMPFDDRGPHGTRIGLTIKPPVLRRRTVAIAAGLVVAGIVYAALVPFNFQPQETVTWRLPLDAPRPGDALANILVYIPVGVLLRLVLRRRHSRKIVECAAALVAALTISYAAEFLQQWLPGRAPTLTDTLCNVGGAALGVLMAPLAQRRIRQFHAWLYEAVHTAPLAAASSLLLIVICTYALVPLDVRPTSSHLSSTLGRLQASWQVPLFTSPELSPPDVLSKWVAASAWGGLAFLLTLAARESNCSPAASACHAWTRSCCMAACIEMVQLYTVSHVADGQDLARAWLACTTGAVAATVLMRIRPLIHRDPGALVAPVVPFLCPVVFCWFTISAFRSIGGNQAAELSWLPVMGNFNRSWDGLLADYASGFISYVIAICALLAWLRLRGAAPGLIQCLAAGLMAALTLQGIGLLFFGHLPDTAHFALAIAAAGLVHRLDRAMAGRLVEGLPRDIKEQSRGEPGRSALR